MAGDADEEMIESSGEDLEIDMNSQSLKICRCGAYDKIMSATNLLRKRILEAVNNELDQYEQPLGCLLGSSKQIFADCHKEYGPVENDRVILDSSLSEVAQHTSVCRRLIEKFSALSEDSFECKEWVYILNCFSKNVKLPSEFVSQCLTNSKVFMFNAETFADDSVDSERAESLILHSNREVLLSTGMVNRVLNLLFPPDRLTYNLDQLLCDKDLTVEAVVIENAADVISILKTDWISLSLFCGHLAVPFTAAALAYVHCASSRPANVTPPLSFQLLESTISSFATCLSAEALFMEHVFTSFAKLLQKDSELTYFMEILFGLEVVSVWIDFSAAKCHELSSSFWNAISKALSFIEREAEYLKQESESGTEAVAIASPEEITHDETIDENWLERIIKQVPTMIDQQSVLRTLHMSIILVVLTLSEEKIVKILVYKVIIMSIFCEYRKTVIVEWNNSNQQFLE
ncbi:hypothetical protein DICVIV_02688 [Dictyocaulus viviparus]|uniref:Uncharacterized protein n=1 Tax=Dictyocaulus viviparus TaxID=29172 RepID=A0A0D8Y542_DICVI|nr:hypothetical protein DICVIV_02688 [Dictyocaulus viviparus]